MTDHNLPLDRPRANVAPWIGLLAIWAMVRAAWCLYHENRGWAYYAYYRFTGQDMQLLGPPVPALILEQVAHIVLLVSGVGLWRRTKWGWWLTGFVYAFIVCRSLYMMVMVRLYGEATEQAGSANSGPGLGATAVIVAALLFFLYSRSVLDLFGLSGMPKIKVAAVQILAAILALMLTTVIATAIVWNYGTTMVPYTD